MQPRSYAVITEKGNVLRQNRQHLLPTAESFDDTEDSSDEESTSDDIGNHLQSATDSASSVTKPAPRHLPHRQPVKRRRESLEDCSGENAAQRIPVVVSEELDAVNDESGLTANKAEDKACQTEEAVCSASELQKVKAQLRRVQQRL
ncbi:hypothetical protein MRX96_001514 [Rhipicephalus microplus]